MKVLMTICGLLFISFGFSQEIKPTAEEIAPDTYKVKYYHNNGKVMHEGNYIDGKSNGLWKSYDEEGLWNFYKGEEVSSVSYNTNSIAEIKKFYTNHLAVK
jgi:antitoxin component YwqK of YwqJK toxin-antitoxin module